MKSRWLEYKGARILHADFANFGHDLDGLAAEIKAALELAEQESDRSVLGMADVRGTVLSREVAGLLKESVTAIGPQFAKTAVVMDQITGFKKVIFDAIGRVSGRNAMLFEHSIGGLPGNQGHHIPAPRVPDEGKAAPSVEGAAPNQSI